MSASDSGRARVLIAAVVAVGAVGVGLYFALSSASGGSGPTAYRRLLKAGALNRPAEADPHEATRVAVAAIRDGKIAGVGQLVALLRGPPAVTFPGEKHRNALRLRVPAAVIQFLQESYLPAAARAPSPSLAAVMLPSERPMMAQLVACDFALRRLERERATPFDNADRAHVNLLQQLWVAAGRPLATYSRTGPHWGELGFQGDDPATDLRGAGILGLRQLVSFAQHQPAALREMVAFNKAAQDEGRDCWYLLAVVSLQFTAQLLLQRDHPLFPAHLRVVYDTVVVPRNTGAGAGAAVGNGGGGAAATARPMSREARELEVGQQSQVGAEEAAARVWADGACTSDAEAGMFLLHEKLLLHFKACWEAAEPHVMTYNTFVAEKVFPTFFNSTWSA